MPVFLLGFFAFLMACSDTASKQKSNSEEELPYDIDAPEGWTKKVMPAMGQRSVFLLSPAEENDEFRENINVLTESSQGMSRDEYLSRSLEVMQSQLTDLVTIKQSERNINGLNFHYHKFTHSHKGMSFVTESYCLIKKDRVYVITCSAMAGTIQTWQSQFDKAVRSFRLN